ncbi:MAG: TlyA family rRNA (cytidine-2'-O)-methyltransferase, partial [Atribacterota bacterium]|nr:TlyA family rRNA (cytidine-2'-O)-methyltransferase [Atribacterota bacterium]
DVSFISLLKVLPVIEKLLNEEGKVIALIKPQLEAGRENVKKGGIVNNPAIHKKIIDNLISEMKDYFNFIDLTFSPIKNSPGNIEFLLYLTKNQNNVFYNDKKLIDSKVNEAHKYFEKNN